MLLDNVLYGVSTSSIDISDSRQYGLIVFYEGKVHLSRVD